MASSVVMVGAFSYLITSSVDDLKTLEVESFALAKQKTQLEVLNNIKDKAYPITIQKINASLDKEVVISTGGKTKTTVWTAILLEAVAVLLMFVGQIRLVLLSTGNREVKTVTTEEVTEGNSNEDSSTAVYAQKLLQELERFRQHRGNISGNKILLLLETEDLKLPPNTLGKIGKTSRDEAGGVSLNKMAQIYQRLKQLKG